MPHSLHLPAHGRSLPRLDCCLARIADSCGPKSLGLLCHLSHSSMSEQSESLCVQGALEAGKQAGISTQAALKGAQSSAAAAQQQCRAAQARCTRAEAQVQHRDAQLKEMQGELEGLEQQVGGTSRSDAGIISV